MPDRIHPEVQRLIDSFVSELTVLARRTALRVLALELTPEGSVVDEAKSLETPVATHAPTKRTLDRSSSSKRTLDRSKPSPKRDAASFARISARVLATLGKTPGLRIEQMNRELGTRPRELQLPLRRLIADHKVRSTGNGRSMKYFAVARKR